MISLCLCGVFFSAGCRAPGAQTDADVQAAPADAAAVPAEVQAAADALLGTGAEVLAFGDLAQDGHQQALVANRFGQQSDDSAGDIRLRRAAILEQNGSLWREVLRCDEYLKNPAGYLGGAENPVTGWQLAIHRDDPKGFKLDFTPLPSPGAARPRTVGVRWNPSVKRYQSLDAASGRFVHEESALEGPTPAELR